MINISKVDEKTISVSKDGVSRNYPAAYTAYESKDGKVCINPNAMYITNIALENIEPANLQVNGAVQASGSAAVVALNQFIGNFKGSGGSGNTPPATNTSLGTVKGGSDVSIVNGEMSVIGGDSDMVDGKHAADFMPYINGDLPVTSTGDLAYYKSLKNGIYTARSGIMPGQPSEWGIVFVMQGYPNDVVVLWFSMANGATYKNQNALGWQRVVTAEPNGDIIAYKTA